MAGVERLGAREPAGVRMLAIIGTLLFAMKAVVAVEGRATGGKRLAWWRWLGFAALWPGMRPGPFARSPAGPLPGSGRLLGMGLARLLAGSALVALARLAWVGTGSRMFATVLLLPGLSLVLHFGLFNLVAGAWRRAGVDCRPLFVAPLRSTSLGEFWGRRWNLAFSQMTAIAIYQPLVRRAGRRAALAASFLGSGLLHELAISVPVRAGYGLPMAYFALHGALVMAEAPAGAGRSPDRPRRLGRSRLDAGLAGGAAADPLPPAVPRRGGLAADRDAGLDHDGRGVDARGHVGMNSAAVPETGMSCPDQRCRRGPAISAVGHMSSVILPVLPSQPASLNRPMLGSRVGCT